MARRLVGLVLLLAAAPPLLAQAPGEPIRLTIHPAAVPTPALKYQLLPEAKDWMPGNAVQLYYRAFAPEWYSWRWRQSQLLEKIANALHAPLKELPREELGSILTGKQFQEVDQAARREYADWEFTPRLKTEGVGMLLPDVQSFREFGNIIALRARMELADGHYDRAAYSLQTGFAMSRHVANAPLLISALVGMAIAGVQLGQVEEWIRIPGSPNLYWALTDLPRPFISLYRPLQGERLWIYGDVPLLRDLESGPLSPQQQQALVDQLLRLGGLEGTRHGPFEERLALLALVLKGYPEAKRALLAQGRKPSELEAMPVIQVYMIHALQEYRRLQDDLFKWFGQPYPVAQAGMERADQQIRQARARLQAMPLIDLLPALARVNLAAARLDRHIAALRCVEAVRLYAAGHGGKLPEKLNAITEVPIPLDPMTGKAFAYKVEGDQATLTAGPPPGMGQPSQAAYTLVYELTLKR